MEDLTKIVGKLDQDLNGLSDCLEHGSSGDQESTIPMKYFLTPDMKKQVEPGSLLINNARGSCSRACRIRSDVTDCRDCMDITPDSQSGSTPLRSKPVICSDDWLKNALTTAVLACCRVAGGLKIASGGGAPRSASIQPKASKRVVTDLAASLPGAKKESVVWKSGMAHLARAKRWHRKRRRNK